MSPPTALDASCRSRADLQRLVARLVSPVLPRFSAGGAQVRLGATHAWYGEPGELLEGFSRPLWGLVPLGAGGGAFAHWGRWRDGLSAGTDSEHPEFWGWPGDFDQRIVEMAAIALGLLLLPGELWSPLSPGAQGRLAAWLARVNAVRPVDNNWLFFRVLVNLALRQCGGEWSQEKLTHDLRRLDDFHLGGGWYSDGPPDPQLRNGRLGDYYVGTGMHFYGLLYAQLARAEDAPRAELYASRARDFARDFVHWFAGDGSALPFGRSLTYRFAQGSFWGALAFAGVEALPWPVIKGLYLRHLRWWLRQPILSDSGLLTIGYAYPNLLMAESYNGPASPYWALKMFLPLALPAGHPFWMAEEEPLPTRPTIHTVAGAKLILWTGPRAEEVVALNPGQPVGDWPRHASHKYSKFAYSTRFGFSVPAGAATLEEGGFDSVLALSDDGRHYRAREQSLDPAVGDGVAYSRWRPWPDVEVRTWLIAADVGHVRVHQVSSGRPLWSAEGGFAPGYERRDTLRRGGQGGRIEVQTPWGCSGLRDLSGGRTGEMIELGVNSHLLHSLAAMPVLRAVHAPGQHWLVCFAQGGAPATGGKAAADDAWAAQVGDGRCVILRGGSPWWETPEAGGGLPSPSPRATS